MICVEQREISTIPALHVVKQELSEYKLPLVLFIHGFTSAKEHNLHYAYLLAEKGYRVILPDVLYHGERSHGHNEAELSLRFWEIVLHTIGELNILKEELEQAGLIDASRIGIAGTSMGGIVTLGAMSTYQWIGAAVSLMGMPYYEKFAEMQIAQLQKKGVKIPLSDAQITHLFTQIKEFDLSAQPEKLNGRPLLFWHGVKDQTVPYTPTHRFYENILPMYSHSPEKLHFITDQRAGHKVSREGLLQTVNWFEKFV
ncbi:alpha/beta fold hydrolase [Cytobacillus gottheilii]|uniref:alpha/beta fold hydrolase n=1 Tax=Cytobacillus gottheilii TaxID=859144 RepID=UPI0009B9CE78|nr:alpha/beta fold hydrolase [Cytobacillus gottheilii]